LIYFPFFSLFFFVEKGPAAADYLQMPSLMYVPLVANGITFTYNLPHSITNGRTFALTGLNLCAIFRGNITVWSDPRIKANNPDMIFTGANALNTPITVISQSVSSSTQTTFWTYCNKIDPTWAIDVPLTSILTLPNTVVALGYPGSDPQTSAIADTSFSLGITTLAYAAVFDLPPGAIINTKGVPVLPSQNSMALTMFELATDGYPTGKTSFDLTNPGTAQAWPMMTMTYVFIDAENAISTCANKRMLQKFLQYFYSSSVVKSITEALSYVPLADVLVSQLHLQSQLEKNLECDNLPLTSSTTQISTIGVNALISDAITLYTHFYLDIDQTVEFIPRIVHESLIIERVALGEISMGIVMPAALTDKDILLMAEGKAIMIPAFMSAIIPTFNLPDEIRALYANPSAMTELTLPPLYPLRLDVETMTHLFIGNINSWLDERLVVLNPQLPDWFAATNASNILTLIVGASAEDDSLAWTRLLFLHMSHTVTGKNNSWAFRPPAVPTGPASNPFINILAKSAAATDQMRVNITMIDTESRLFFKVKETSGAISYGTIQTVTDITAHFEMVTPSSKMTSSLSVSPNIASLSRCGTRFTQPSHLNEMGADELGNAIDFLGTPENQRNWVDTLNPEVGCWPLSTLLSFVVKVSYSSAKGVDVCTQGLHSLEFINYVQSTHSLSKPMDAFAQIRLADNSLIARYALNQLNTATCDHQAMLIILPIIYSISSAIHNFAIAIAAIGFIGTVISAILVVSYRLNVVIRSSSTPFLCIILLGMSLLLGAIPAWASTPTNASCSAFLWLVNMGFMCLFCPLFAKTWRVWRIFSGSHLRIVKISNQKLMAITGAVLLADIILIAVWQGIAPLVPIEYDRIIGSDQHLFTHCSVRSTGSGVIFVGLVAAEKAGLLLFGAIMAFSTRNVKGSFNESAAISWSLYNTLMSLIIGLSIIIFIKAVEDTLMVLVVLLLCWIIISAWGLLFLPKFHLLFQSEQELIEQSRSEIMQEKSNGFSFASIAVMTGGQIKAYYSALKMQLNKAERAMELPLTIWAATAVGPSVPSNGILGGTTTGASPTYTGGKNRSGMGATLAGKGYNNNNNNTNNSNGVGNSIGPNRTIVGHASIASGNNSFIGKEEDTLTTAVHNMFAPVRMDRDAEMEREVLAGGDGNRDRSYVVRKFPPSQQFNGNVLNLRSSSNITPASAASFHRSSTTVTPRQTMSGTMLIPPRTSTGIEPTIGGMAQFSSNDLTAIPQSMTNRNIQHTLSARSNSSMDPTLNDNPLDVGTIGDTTRDSGMSVNKDASMSKSTAPVHNRKPSWSTSTSNFNGTDSTVILPAGIGVHNLAASVAVPIGSPTASPSMNADDTTSQPLTPLELGDGMENINSMAVPNPVMINSTASLSPQSNPIGGNNIIIPPGTTMMRLRPSSRATTASRPIIS
jgi:phosphate transport system substrate-binding protein